jgi:hypothetical protein
MSVSGVTRRNIIDTLIVEKVNWSGRLDEVEFLGRLYDLNSMRTHDHRFSSAAGDIRQHRINNPDDWSDDWIYGDPRFNLAHCEDEQFLAFLCEMIHPIVRPNQEDVNKLLNIFNDNLAVDGWQLVEIMRISDKPVFAARPLIDSNTFQINTAKEIASKLDSAYISQQIIRMESSINNDPELAIGTAKEFVETISKTILSECGEVVGKDESLIDLVKRARGKINLLPDNIPPEAKGADTIKRILSNLGTIAQGLAELRSIYGSGHGKEVSANILQPRHARLAVGAATTLGVFLYETYEDNSA